MSLSKIQANSNSLKVCIGDYARRTLDLTAEDDVTVATFHDFALIVPEGGDDGDT